MTVKKKKPELKVVFDTNVLWTGSASDLLKQEVCELIEANSQHSDLAISWYLPDIVRHERQFQMLAQSIELLPPIKKLERLLGHNLNITEKIIEQRVNEAVESQISKLGITIIPLDTARVEWGDVILNAAYRRPPFSQGPKEKGFRDALLVEAFLQLVSDSPVTPKVCRIALVTSDDLLGETVTERSKNNANVRILSSLEELKSLINTLVSEVGEEFVAKIQSKAQTYFFEPDQKETIFVKENVQALARTQLKKELNAIPEAAQFRENGTWYVSPPRFLKKSGQRVSWASRITVEAKAYKYEAVINPLSASANLMNLVPIESKPLDFGNFIAGPSISNFAQMAKSQISFEPSAQPFASLGTTEKTLVKTGKSVFDVIWTVTVTATGKLSSPKIDSIKFIETSWE